MGLPSKIITDICNELNINPNQFAKSIGLERAQIIYDLINGKTKSISNKLIRSITNTYPQFNDQWLLTGEGDMLKTPSKEGKGNDTTEEKLSLPLIPVDAIAGFPAGDVDGVELAKCERYSVPEFSSRGADFMIRVSGSSMYPKYSNGDLLACKKIPEITFFQWGKVYVLDTVQGALVKRLFEDKSNSDNVICHSDNVEHYPEFSLPKTEIRSLSVVLGVIRAD